MPPADADFPIRPAQLTGGVQSDLPGMHRLDVLCFTAPFRFSVTNLRRYATEPDAIVLVANHPVASLTDDLAGFVIIQVYPQTNVAYVVTLDVHPKLRRLGLAAQLMAEGERRAHLAGAQKMHLHVFAGNDGAITFYERTGYVRQTLEKELYGRGLDAWTYSKRLSNEAA